MTSTKDNSVDLRSGKDRRSSNQPEHIGLVDRLEAMKASLSHEARLVLEAQARDTDQDVKVKLEVECSEGLARDLIGGIVSLLHGKNSERRIQDPSEAPHYLDESSRSVEANEGSPVEKHASVSTNEMRQNTASVHCTRPRKLSSILLIFLLTIATAIGGFEYVAYKKKIARELAEARQVQKNQKLYEQYLASSLDILLSKLDQLTATPKMSRVFPEITSMSAIARFKRGSEAADKARAARGFIYRVREIFDNWTERANDFSSEERPGKKEITYFLSVWNDTETILNQLEAAKNDPSTAAKMAVQ